MSKLGIYRESGSKAVVEVLSDTTTNEWSTFTQRSAMVLREAALCPMAVGDEWTSEAKVGQEHWCWDLSYDDAALREESEVIR